MSDVDEPATSIQNPEMEVTKESSNTSLSDTNAATLETNVVDEVPKNKDSPEKHFATIEGELLDFEDFNEKLPDVDKTTDAKSSESEDGQCVSPENACEKADSIEEGEDEGACSEDEDLEEGEISSEKKENSQPAVCRFYHRGMCYYGSACRFLHPNDKKGNYNMFEPIPKIYADSYSAMGSSMGILNHRRSIPFLPAPPPPVYEVESAWERGLKEAKVLLKRASKRKDEPDFEEKRLNMGLASCKKYPSDFDKENDSSPKRERRNKSGERRGNFKYHDAYNYDDYIDPKDSYPYLNESEKNPRERSKARKSSVERYSRTGSRQWNNSRSEDVRTQRSDNPHTYFDPWQRSRSPMRNRTSRSVSCSPVSSYSRSSHSSRSSSRSSYASSRRTSSSRSRSRSHSRSLSMDSVSSASSQNSSASHSSGSALSRNRKAKPVSRAATSSNPYTKSPPKVKVKTEPLDEIEDIMEEKFQKSESETIANLHHLMPNFSEKAREPVRGLHKQQIKLTLLNKNPHPKLPNPLKSPEATKKAEVIKTNLQRKRPLSPPVQAPTVVKKSATTRRDDLLKQLRAVEDAIARKRAKF